MDNVEATSGLILRHAMARRRQQAEMARRKSALKSPAAKQRGDLTESKNTLEFLESIASPRRVTFSPYVARKTKKIKQVDQQDEEIHVNEQELTAAVRKQCKMRMRYRYVRRPALHVRMARYIESFWSNKSYDLLQPMEDELPRELRLIPDFTAQDREYGAYYDSKLQEHTNAQSTFIDRKNQVELSLPSQGSYAQITRALTPPSISIPPSILSLQKDLPGVRRLCFDL
ncbi:hypothetical protein THRCLA_05871 [Thraustotheca clavata]|uniref:Uncharacterized protein n=1 Tax=Thraustotheca clavata TaxID=74557 RepID=A0A1V9ZSI4_9STRA|nr:hypothetical protein THRCLA_05871 [Thraustotheca clavata]